MTEQTRTVLITNRRGLHARASAKFVTLASTQPCEVRVAKDGSTVTGTSIMGLMMLGPRWATPSRSARRGRRRGHDGRGTGRAGGSEVRRRLMPREITAYSNPLIKWARDLRDKRHRKQSRQFLAEGLRILTEARETGRLPTLLFYARPSAGHPLVRDLIAAVEASEGEAIETTPDILSKLSGKDNPQAVVGVFEELGVTLGELDRMHPVSGWSPSVCAIRAIWAPSCAPAMRSGQGD